jgi:hypothetical protein
LILAHIIGIVAAVTDWVTDSRFDGLALSFPPAGEQTTPVEISISSLQYLYLSDIVYTLDIAYSLITNLYMTCDSKAVNFFAKWLVHLKDLRIKKLWADEPFNESLQMKQLIRLYIGHISEDSEGMAGEYLIMLVDACPNVSILMLTR